MDEYFSCNMTRADTQLVEPIWNKGQDPFPSVKSLLCWASTHSVPILVIRDGT